jgi:hypothetical protein
MRHHDGTRPPTLINHRVDIAIITSQITSTVDLKYEIPES